MQKFPCFLISLIGILLWVADHPCYAQEKNLNPGKGAAKEQSPAKEQTDPFLADLLREHASPLLKRILDNPDSFRY
jgi:hypothetical protein